ncbi:hypothetical protein BD410DRAFT_770233 [Rickenella mellea]|uniref:6-phosphogluconate dehydrogenase C-terminal domain-like protein n=1 Tax=Rickenella mellea TaxID=50990 RepID=A0A4Y7Q4Q8_9AGAM|nr:hypothetical protein BD410DRAFT_770233 [Rickenella mellea]
MDSPVCTVTIVSAGAMGAALARLMTRNGCTVLTNLDGRSESTRRRAADAGMLDVSLDEIARRSDWIFSILPPAEARSFSLAILRAYDPDSGPVFVDCNAKNPETAKALSEPFKFTPIVFIDASIIGLPPNGDHIPTLYASARPSDAKALNDFLALSRFGLRIKILEGEGSGIGDASALKMSFSGIMKGMVALYTTIILSAHAQSPAVSRALIRELSISQPNDARNIAFYVPNSFSKAYRFVREMEEMAGFISDRVDGRSHGSGNEITVSDIYRGFSGIFQRVADSLEQGTNDVETLKNMADEADQLLILPSNCNASSDSATA